MKNQLTPTQLRVALALALLVAIAAGIGGFILLRGALMSKANDIATMSAEVKGLADNVRKLESAERILKANQDVEIKARDMVAESKSYQYQDRIVSDISSMATSSGVMIKSIDFTAAQTQSAPAPTPDGAGTVAPSSNLPGGINQTKATIAIKNPVSYRSLLMFIRALETNAMKIQVDTISITKADSSEDSPKDGVNSDTFILGVYIR